MKKFSVERITTSSDVKKRLLTNHNKIVNVVVIFQIYSSSIV
ncbi:hypothetical protein [Clostridioides sp. ES-S-0077-01]